MLTFVIEDSKKAAILHINGELFHEKLAELEKVWAEQVKKPVPTIAIDCQQLNYIDSPAIGTLVKFFNEAMSKGKKLVFYGLNPSIQSLFDSARLERFFTITTKEKFDMEYK